MGHRLGARPTLLTTAALAMIVLGGLMGGAPGAASAFLLCVASFPVVRALSTGVFDSFELIHAFFAYTLFTILVRGWLDLVYGGPILGPRFATHSEEFRGLMALVFVCTGVFLAAFQVGYYSPVGPRLAALPPRLKARPTSRLRGALEFLLPIVVSLPAAIVLRHQLGAAVARGGYFAASRAGGIAGVAFVLRFALAGAYILLARTAGTTKRGPFMVGLIYALGLSLMIFSLVPTKILVATTIFVALGIYHYLRRPIRLMTILGVVSAGLVFIPVLTAYRQGLSIAQIIALIQSLPSNPHLLIAGLLQRSFGADSMYVILQGERLGMPFQYGGTFTGILWFWVPRSLWDDKPVTSAIWFWEQYLRQSDYFPPYVSASPTMVGELYLNFWWVGVVLGGVALGIGYRAIYAAFLRNRTNPVAVVTYLLAFVVLVKAAEGPITDHIQELLVSTCTCLAVVFIVDSLAGSLGYGRSPRESGPGPLGLPS